MFMIKIIAGWFTLFWLCIFIIIFLCYLGIFNQKTKRFPLRLLILTLIHGFVYFYDWLQGNMVILYALYVMWNISFFSTALHVLLSYKTEDADFVHLSLNMTYILPEIILILLLPWKLTVFFLLTVITLVILVTLLLIKNIRKESYNMPYLIILFFNFIFFQFYFFL